MENITNISKVPTAPGTKKEYYYKEILTAYNVAVENAIKDGALENDSLNKVCEELWDDGGDEQTLNKMRLGFLPPSPELLSFIKEFAGEKYNYTFLASEPGRHSAISKIRLTAEGRFISSDEREVSSSEMNNEKMCRLFLNFVARKNCGEMAEDFLFYDYLRTEPLERQKRDPLFYDYDQDRKTVLLQNFKILDALTELDWYLTRVTSEIENVGPGTWNLIDQLIPNLAEQSTTSENAKSLIRVRDRVNTPMNLSSVEFSFSEYKIEFILSIPHLTPDGWNILIKLVALRELSPELYTEVANLILQAFKVLQHSMTFQVKA